MTSTCYYCRPSDRPLATMSMQAGAADAAFPVTQAQDGFGWTVFKSTGTNFTVRSTFASPVTIEAIVLAYHRLAGATVTVKNAAGFSNALPIPANTLDGHCVNPWEDYRGLSLVTSNVWDVEVTGAPTVGAIGEILWIQTLRELVIDRGSRGGDVQPAVVHPGDYHPMVGVYGMGSRWRPFRAHVVLEDVAADLLALHQDARGPLKPFALIPDSTVNSALYAHLLSPEHLFTDALARGSGARDADVEFVETLTGLSL